MCQPKPPKDKHEKPYRRSNGDTKILLIDMSICNITIFSIEGCISIINSVHRLLLRQIKFLCIVNHFNDMVVNLNLSFSHIMFESSKKIIFIENKAVCFLMMKKKEEKRTEYNRSISRFVQIKLLKAI